MKLIWVTINAKLSFLYEGKTTSNSSFKIKCFKPFKNGIIISEQYYYVTGIISEFNNIFSWEFHYGQKVNRGQRSNTTK